MKRSNIFKCTLVVALFSFLTAGSQYRPTVFYQVFKPPVVDSIDYYKTQININFALIDLNLKEAERHP